MLRYEIQVAMLLTLLLTHYIQGVLSTERANLHTDYTENEIEDYPNLAVLTMKNNKQVAGDLVDTLLKKSALHSQKFTSKAIPFFKTLHSPCMCEMEYETIDLGTGYYPRYVRNGKCNMDSCGKYRQCRQKEYKIKVFKKREDIDGDDMFQGFPESLQRDWQPASINVVVACECVSNNF